MNRDNVIEEHPRPTVEDGSLGLSKASHERARTWSREQWQRAMNKASGGELDRLKGLEQLRMSKQKEWFEKNKKLNKDHVLKIGDRLVLSPQPLEKDLVWVVIDILEGFDIEEHGFITLRKESSPSTIDEDHPDFNDHCCHYIYFGWQEFFRIVQDEENNV